MKWIIENLQRGNDITGLIEEIRKQGIEALVLDVGNKYALKVLPENEPVVFIGSIQSAAHYKQVLKNCDPVIWYTADNYLCSNYYPYFADLLFNDEHSFIPAGCLKNQMWHYYRMYSKEALIYVRPNSGEKTFTGQLLDMKDFGRMFDVWKSYGLKDNDLVVVSAPKNIKGEWRFICDADGEIIAVSSYKYDGLETLLPGAPLEATEKCMEVLQRPFKPDKFFTVDICLGADGKYYLLELNSFNSAGMYAADKAKVVNRIMREFL